MKRILIALAVVLNLSLALAAVDVHFNGVSEDGPVDEFNMFAFDCLDPSCSQVRDFSGVMLDGTFTHNGTLTVRFPDSLATQYGYALFAVDESEEYRPLEIGPAVVHSHGNSFIFESDLDLEFTKIAHCRSLVHDMSVVNTARPNIPLVVAMDAALYAETVSAFRKVDNGIGFVPGLIDDWYSAETRVVLEIIDDDTGAVIHQDSRMLNLYADSSQRVEFSYVPRNEGRYSARIRSEVTDSACEVVTPESSVKMFEVLDDVPNDECYTLLNNLELDNAFPQPGNVVAASVNKISNYANTFGVLSPVATLVQILVSGPAGETVYSNFVQVGANANAVDPFSIGFSWLAQRSGIHRVTVSAIADDFRCDLRPNSMEIISTEVFVEDPVGGNPGDQPDPEDFAFDVTFFVRDEATGADIEDAKVRFVENALSDETNDDGVATIDNVVNGVYTFKVTHEDYESVTGIVVVDNADEQVVVELDFDLGDDFEESDRTHIAVSSVRIPSSESVMPGEVLELSVNLDNDGNNRLEDAQATVTILELGVHDSVGPFDIRTGESMTKRLFVNIPEWAQEGVYNARVTIGAGKHTRVVYREIRVVEKR